MRAMLRPSGEAEVAGEGLDPNLGVPMFEVDASEVEIGFDAVRTLNSYRQF
jgi:hypothetical protein